MCVVGQVSKCSNTHLTENLVLYALDKKRHWCGEVPKTMLLETPFPDSSIFIFQHCYVGPCCKIKDCFIWCGRKDFNFKDLKSKPGSTGATRHAEFLKGATSWYAPLKKFRPNFSSSSFVIRVNLLHPQPSLFLYGLLIGRFRLDYEYEIEYEYDFSFLVFRLHITTTHTHFIP